jgi:uncharacterized protein YjhX (UPF0386 family)
MAVASIALTAAFVVSDARAAGTSSAARSAAVEETAIGCPELTPRLRSPARFLNGLVGAWVPEEARHCLYIISARMSRPAAIYRIDAGRTLRGPVWSPTRPELVVAHRRGRGFQVALLDTDGSVLRRLSGRDAAFFRDGRMLLRQLDRLWLVGKRKQILAGRAALERAAGFRITGYDLSSVDGYGRSGVVVTVWGTLRSRLLLVTSDGRFRRITPIYRADDAGASMPGPPAWSPDGRILLIPWQRTHPTNAATHEHCLARWSASRGYRVTFCRDGHFHRILWHPDAGIALLNNGLVVARDASVRARLPLVGRGLSVRWKQPLLEKPG